jgi:hypothetical protein
MIASITGYLAGAKVDKETPIFRGVGNLSVLAPDESFFFLGVSIAGSIALTFGDQTNDDLVFLAANYEPTAKESLSQLVFLEKAVFESWFLNDGNPPQSEEWCLIPFCDWTATNNSNSKINETNSFKDTTTFQASCATFIRHCTKLKQENDPFFNRLLLIRQVDEEDSKLDRHESSEDENEEEEHDGEDGKDDGEVGITGSSAEPKKTPRKPREKRDPNAKGERSSDRQFAIKLNGHDPLRPPFQMPKRDLKPAGGSAKKTTKATAKQSKQKKESKKRTLTNTDPPAPAKVYPPKRSLCDNDSMDVDDGTPSVPPKNPKARVVGTPFVSNTPMTVNQDDAFDIVMAQQDKVLSYQQKFAGFIFGAAERYSNRG